MCKNIFKTAALLAVVVVAIFVANAFPAYAAQATYSANWYQSADGTWHIKDVQGKTVTNAWLCDDAVPENGKNVWYLLDKNGDMISAELVQDGTGNYYSLETNHDGYYGMLRYKNGVYNCNGTMVYLEFNQEHNGSFGAVVNPDGLTKLKGLYGVTRVELDNRNIIYTSSFATIVGVSPETPTIAKVKAATTAPILMDGYYEGGYYLTSFGVDPARVHVPKHLTFYYDEMGIIQKILVINPWDPDGKTRRVLTTTEDLKYAPEWSKWMGENTPVPPM